MVSIFSNDFSVDIVKTAVFGTGYLCRYFYYLETGTTYRNIVDRLAEGIYPNHSHTQLKKNRSKKIEEKHFYHANAESSFLRYTIKDDIVDIGEYMNQNTESEALSLRTLDEYVKKNNINIPRAMLQFWAAALCAPLGALPH